ncbi:hypothetical protein PHET_01941 [Paragonimus heterotremus]|uniref:G-protein coupled receptors family 1 profile domain-containing protein n=1 Tax=Paragonimus heterotremus TaxID=100268 RepID=A0A8J4X2X0_9TREM|nr:hypothetical protein PHET_01941 [Paragonimus heterotremus]
MIKYSSSSETGSIRYYVTAGFQFALLVLVLTLNIVENSTLLCISLNPVYRWCQNRFRKRQYFDHFPSNSSSNKACARKSLQPERKLLDETAEPDVRVSTPSPGPFCSRQLEMEEQAETSGSVHKYCSSSERVGIITRYYFGNLCLANLTLAFLAMPFSIAASLGTNRSPNTTLVNITEKHRDNILLKYPIIINELMCTFVESTVGAILMVSILSLVQLTADRMVAICVPLHYARWITERRAIASILFVWFFSVALFAVPHICVMWFSRSTPDHSVLTYDTDIYRCFVLGQHDVDEHWRMAVVFFVFIFMLPLVFIIVSYVKIYLTVRQCMKRLVRIENRPSVLQLSEDCGTIGHVPHHNSARDISTASIQIRAGWKKTFWTTEEYRRSQKIQARAAKTAFIFVSSFLFLTAPFFLFMLIGSFFENNFDTMETNSNRELSEMLSSVTVWFLYVNSFVTPGLYCCRDGVLRRRICSLRNFVRYGR